MKTFFAVIISLSLCSAAHAQKIPAWKITDVINYYSQKNDSIYVINFFATWCRPCIAEMPHLQSITKKYADKKVKLMLVSLDFATFYPGKIMSFAKRKRIKADIAWLDETDADYFCSAVDKRWSGSIPATIIVNAATGYKEFYEQQFMKREFEEALKKAFDK